MLRGTEPSGGDLITAAPCSVRVGAAWWHGVGKPRPTAQRCAERMQVLQTRLLAQQCASGDERASGSGLQGALLPFGACMQLWRYLA